MKFPISEKTAMSYGICPVCSNELKVPVRLKLMSIVDKIGEDKVTLFFGCFNCKSMFYSIEISRETYNKLAEQALVVFKKMEGVEQKK